LAILLQPCALLYRAAAFIHRFLYDAGIRKRVRVPATVISIGSIEVGGTGKTPVAIWLARRLLERGLSVAVVARNLRSGRLKTGRAGTGRGEAVPANRVLSVARTSMHSVASMFSDEVLLLVRSLPGVSVYTGRSKSAAAARACREVSPDVILVDDGFQHHRLEKDLELIVVDFEKPFGIGGLLPAGTLREPPGVLSEADFFWAHRKGVGRSEEWLRKRLDAHNWRAPLVCSRLIPGCLRLSGEEESEIDPEGVSVVAFCGIGKPWSFRKTLEAAGCRILGFVEFSDHHQYTEYDLDQMEKLRRSRGAEATVTTAKDIVKTERMAHSGYLYFLDISLALDRKDAEQVLGEIDKLVSPGIGYARAEGSSL
jgi:tetraacyldisaccharide 4'-kinase